jgi:ribosome-associated heat shock protein Hsp15
MSPSDRHAIGTTQARRIDAWLKMVCLFKHRADATEACKGGHVKINGQRVKPAAAVKPQDVVEFYLGDRYRKVIVEVVPERQLSKEDGRTAYTDQSPPPQRVELFAPSRDPGTGRPTKRERRELEKWKK